MIDIFMKIAVSSVVLGFIPMIISLVCIITNKDELVEKFLIAGLGIASLGLLSLMVVIVKMAFSTV